MATNWNRKTVTSAGDMIGMDDLTEDPGLAGAVESRPASSSSSGTDAPAKTRDRYTPNGLTTLGRKHGPVGVDQVDLAEHQEQRAART